MTINYKCQERLNGAVMTKLDLRILQKSQEKCKEYVMRYGPTFYNHYRNMVRRRRYDMHTAFS